jgi:methyl-accepting chemotaxis protein
VGQRIATLADEVAAAKWTELELHAHDADHIESVAKRNMGIILGFTGISSLLLGLYLPRTIVVPIRKLTNLIKRAQEKFRINIDVASNDEIGELGRFINRITDKIRAFDRVFRELAADNGERRAGDGVGKEGVEELAERLRAVLQAKGDREDQDGKPEGREVG